MFNKNTGLENQASSGVQVRSELSRRKFVSLSGSTLVFLALSHNVLARALLNIGMADELTGLTLRQASDLLRKKETSSVELTRACLAHIERYQPVLNAFITVVPEKALEQARALDAERRIGKWRGPLHGIPIALKDNIDTAGIRTTAASALFADRIPDEDAEVVRRLKAAGAVILGKLNMDEFALGGSSASTYFKPVHNPWALDRVPSGSSGGSAVAVAAGLCFGALGTDTTGSIRGPASVCSIVGLKPTNGRVSNRGVIPFLSTLDVVGPMCRTVEDTALMLQALAGYDPGDVTSVEAPVPDYSAAMKAPVKRLRIGVPRQQFFDERDPEIIPLTEDALSVLKSLTAGVREVELPSIKDMGINPLGAEAYAYHAAWFAKSPGLYQPSLRRYLERAAKVSGADYAAALHQIYALRRRVAAVFKEVDVLVTPGRKRVPGRIEDIVKGFASDAVPPPELGTTQHFSVFGLPAIMVPGGFTKEGFPVGVQIVGPHWGEGKVLALACAYEQATEWHKRRPPLTPQTAGK